MIISEKYTRLICVVVFILVMFATAFKPYQVTQQATGTPQVASNNIAGRTTAVGTTTLFATGSSNAYYQLVGSVNCNSAVSAATVNLTIGWTDPSNTAQSMTLGTVAACTTLGTTSFNDLQKTFRAKASTNITFSTSIVGSPNYDISVALYQVSTQ